jgi:hypothetical protein
MPRSLYKQGVRHPLNPENSEFLHTLGQKRTFNGSVANNLFKLKKVEYPIIAKKRFVVFTVFFEFVGE